MFSMAVCLLMFLIADESASLTNLHRQKRQDDIYQIWGYAVTITKKFRVKTSTSPDLDNPYKMVISSEPPDFTKMGLSRISELKCAEYIWHVQYRNRKSIKSDLYSEYLRKQTPYIPDEPQPTIAGATAGGRDTHLGEFPHMAAIGWKSSIGTWVFKCGGSLISEKFVLTAAHCSSLSDKDTTVEDPVPKIARLGDKNIAENWYNEVSTVDEDIIKIFVHPKYQSPKTYFDVAIMELRNVQEFTKYIQPACLWSKFDTSSLGNEAILTGWGVVEPGTFKVSPELQAATVDLLDSEQCDQLLGLCTRKWCGMQDNQLCAGKLSGGVDSCQGDSGGPLQVKIPLPIRTQGEISYVVGVTSFGKGCALPNTPSVYARVSSVIDWIESIVWPGQS